VLALVDELEFVLVLVLDERPLVAEVSEAVPTELVDADPAVLAPVPEEFVADVGACCEQAMANSASSAVDRRSFMRVSSSAS
jgi:hypothetical protein